MISAALRTAVLALRTHWRVLALLVVCIHWPLDVLESFIVYNWMDPDNLQTTFRVSRTVDQFLRVIPDAAILYVIRGALNGERVGLSSSLAEGVRSYGRMWITRFLSYLSVLSLLLFVLPGIYMMTRWTFSEASVIGEGKAATSAFGRSWSLTRGRFWPVFGALLAGAVVYAIYAGVIIVACLLIADDTWWVDALSSMLSSLPQPLWLAYVFGLYQYLIARTQETDLPLLGQHADANPDSAHP